VTPLVGKMIRCRCGKVATFSERAARNLYGEIKKHTGHGNSVRFYECEFGRWHWTQKDAGPQAKHHDDTKGGRNV
jgi:hypothetical protein